MEPQQVKQPKKAVKSGDGGTSQAVRNMIIGVLTTVVVSGSVYFLGFNKGSNGPTRAERQKATQEAWKAYIASENLAYRNTLGLLVDQAQFERYKDMYQEITNESSKLTSALQQLTEKDNIDGDLVTLMKRRIESEKRSIPYAETFFRALDRVIDTALAEDWDEDRANKAIGARMIQFGLESQRMAERSMNEVAELAGTLSRRYDVPFNLSDFYAYQVNTLHRNVVEILKENKSDSTAAFATPAFIKGKWNIKNSKAILNFDSNGAFTWGLPASPEPMNAKGSWAVNDKRLTLNFTYATDTLGKNIVKGTWTFDFMNVMPGSFCMQKIDKPFSFYILNRL